MSPGKSVTLIGIGDDGCLGLSSRAIGAVAKAQVLVGGERQLAFFPEFDGVRLVLKQGIGEVLDEAVALADEENLCILASGDPLFFGVGSLVLDRLGADRVEVIPQPSSLQWAFAKAGLPWSGAGFLSLHGRPMEGFVARAKQHALLACFTDEKNSPAAIADHMLAFGESEWRAWVCEHLCSPDERVRTFSLEELARCNDIAPLNVLILQRTDPSWRKKVGIPYVHEDLFAKRMPRKGLITKREVRALSLANMELDSDSIIWDIGAASGSIAIEAALVAYEGRAYAIEVDPRSIECCRENVRRFGADNVRIIEGRAPEVLVDIEDAPDAVFVGGSKGQLGEILNLAWQRLRPGGRLVVNVITLENFNEAYTVFGQLGQVPEVTLLQVSRNVPVARLQRYEAQNPIQILAASKPAVGTEER